MEAVGCVDGDDVAVDAVDDVVAVVAVDAVGAVVAFGADAEVVSEPYTAVAVAVFGRDALPRLRRGVDRLRLQEDPRAGLADATSAPVGF